MYFDVLLKQFADAHQADRMAAYMKNQFLFFGVPKPMRGEWFKEWWKNEGKCLTVVERWKFIEFCWEQEQREWQYFGVDVAQKFKKNDFEKSDLQCIRRLLVSKSWWDSVDLLASNVLGTYLQQFPEMIPEMIEDFTNSNNFWLQRSTLIFQLKYKQSTDLSVLSQQIDLLKGKKEFFIQKAIGWSLREVAKWNPDFVTQEVEKQCLVGLAKREALKHL